MHTLVKTACAVHTLSLATAFGGSLFAKAALRRALIDEIKDEKERGRVMACAWNKYNRLNVPAHLLFTATWLIERKAIMTLHVDHRTQKLVALKDVLIAGALVTGLANVAVGKMIMKDYPDGVAINDKPTDDAKLEKYRRYFRVMGPAHMIFVGASMAIGAAIVGGVIRSQRRNILRRLLGD
jgi:uncharacterized membrane protein